MFLLLLLLVIASSLAFIVEGGSASSTNAFSSIPAAMYWAIITMTTIGYGDIVPATTLGRMLTAVTAVLSLGMVAIPTGILASGFSAALERRREEVADRVHDALSDGALTAGEEADIEELVERLNVSDADLQMVMESARRDVKAHARCPHCGLLPDEREGQDPDSPHRTHDDRTGEPT